MTYNDKPPYKIGMTNGVIGKRISSYVNCPSQADGHWIHLLLTWDINNDLSAKTVENYVFNKLTRDNRVNSTQRAVFKNTEHFDETLDTIEKVFREAKQHYKDRAVMEVRRPGNKIVTISNVVKGKNISKGKN